MKSAAVQQPVLSCFVHVAQPRLSYAFSRHKKITGSLGFVAQALLPVVSVTKALACEIHTNDNS